MQDIHIQKEFLNHSGNSAHEVTHIYDIKISIV